MSCLASCEQKPLDVDEEKYSPIVKLFDMFDIRGKQKLCLALRSEYKRQLDEFTSNCIVDILRYCRNYKIDVYKLEHVLLARLNSDLPKRSNSISESEWFESLSDAEIEVRINAFKSLNAWFNELEAQCNKLFQNN